MSEMECFNYEKCANRLYSAAIGASLTQTL